MQRAKPAGRRANEWFQNLRTAIETNLDNLLEPPKEKQRSSGVRGEVLEQFLRKLSHPDNRLILEAMSVFVDTFVGSCREDEYAAQVKSFCASVRVRMYQLELWQPFAQIEMSVGLSDALTECIETWATTQLYSVLITRSRDLEHDRLLYDRLSSLAFLAPQNLEIPDKFWTSPKWLAGMACAAEELLTIGKHKAPLQKLMVIQRSCQIVLAELGDDAGGADTLLPALVFVLISANPPQLWASVQFIRDFRNKSFKGTQLEYYLVSLETTIGFVENLTASDLAGVTAAELAENCEKTLRGELKRWKPLPPPPPPVAPVAVVPRAEDEWIVMPQTVARPVFLICPIKYDAPGLVDYLRHVSAPKSRLVLNCSDEVAVALPEIAIACKAAGLQLVVVGLRAVDWIPTKIVPPFEPFASVEQMLADLRPAGAAAAVPNF